MSDNKQLDNKQAALDYHKQDRPGKLKIVATKPMDTQRDLSLAYSPGVAFPVLAIADEPALAYEYTAKANLVAVISNGTAILGLGDRGALASKPVMEGKAVLFKRFADVDVFDIEVDSKDPQELIRFVQMIAPTFGGVNLEDIKAPECFLIEKELQRTVDIPVFHDDQHGTAIISGAGLINALELVGKKIADVRIVINGAGAAGIACADFYVALGATRDNIIMCDTRGVIYEGRREGMNEYKLAYAVETDLRTLEDALRDADVFIGLSSANILGREAVRSMGRDPILFAMANPDPEITYEEACAARTDIIFGTGRSDYPNQVNNVLGFPFIFRGALRCTRPYHQHGDETGRGTCPGGAGQRRRTRRGDPRLWSRYVTLWPRIYYPQTARPARVDVGGASGGESSYRNWGGAPADRSASIPGSIGRAHGQERAGDASDGTQGAQQSQTGGLRRR